MGKKFEIVGEDISDGYHTFDELYDHRCMLWVLVCQNDSGAWFVKEHYVGWDLLAMTTCLGEQVSYHVPTKFRYLYEDQIQEKDRKFAESVFDGHTSNDVFNRLLQVAESRKDI